MREIKALGPQEQREVYERIYKEAFPPSELRPLVSIEKLSASGEYLTLGLYEGGEALAYASVWRDGRFFLIDYLCVLREKRNRGNGGELLRRLREAYPPDSVFFGESEAPTGDPEADELILQRLEFYKRNGAALLGYDSWLFGVHYKTLAWWSGTPEEAEIMAHHVAFYRRSMPKALYDMAVRIPFDGAAGASFEIWEDGNP